MLKMPIVHTPPPVYRPGQWHHTAAPLDQFGHADQTSHRNLIWQEDQLSPARTFSPLLSLIGHPACTLLFASFLALSGCKKFDELVGARKTESTNTSSMRALPESAFFVGKSRSVWLKPNRELSVGLKKKLEGQAYQAARKLIAKDVKKKVKAALPNDCHFGRFTFGYDIAWNHFSYEMETVRTRKNGWRLVRILCKTTWETGWCKRRYTGNQAKGISGSSIPYSTANPALR